VGITPARNLNIELLQALEDGFLAPFEIGDGGLETMPLAVEVTMRRQLGGGRLGGFEEPIRSGLNLL